MQSVSLLIVSCLAGVVLTLHWRATNEDVRRLIKDLARAAGAWGKVQSTPSPMAVRVQTELCRARMAIFLSFVKLCMHPVMILILMSAVEFTQQPSFCCGVWLACMLLVYMAYYAIATGLLLVTPSILHAARMSLCTVTLTAIAASSNASKEELFGKLGLLVGSQVLQAMVFPAGAGTILLSASHTAGYIWATAQVYGHAALNLWLIVFHITFQLLVCISVPFLIEFTLRECVVASFQSQDSDSLISGFRQMLKGICDGELLLDGDFRISGPAPCLQRLLAGTEDFAGRSFRDLVADEEARQKFDSFMKAEAPQEGQGATTRSTEGAPRCLRVHLKATRGRPVAVDVFHVQLPASLYGANTTYHLLAMAEDGDSREQPDADPSSQNALLGGLVAERGSAVARSCASTETQVEGYEELAEMTLLLDTSSELLDIEEAHLRFVRHTSNAEVRMGMPTLKRFVRPLDWCGIDTALQRYAQQVRKAGLTPYGAREALPPLLFRVPGESRKHLRPRSITISSPFERKEPDAPVFLYLHLTDFRGPPLSAAPQRLEGLREEQPTQPPKHSQPRRRMRPKRATGVQPADPGPSEAARG